MGKNYKLYNAGDKVEIIHSHSNDKGLIGTIVEVRNSFCKIQVPLTKPNGQPVINNHTYGQFKKIE